MNFTEEQEDEILALKSIYEEDSRLMFDVETGDPGGVFMAPQTLSQPLHVCLSNNTAANVGCSTGGKEKDTFTVQYLPPITLNFVIPWDYPSAQAPTFTLSCYWLTEQQLTKLCHRLDEIWEENKGNVILYLWFDFLENELLDFLKITSPLVLSDIVPHRHIHGQLHRKNIDGTSHTHKETLDEKGASDSHHSAEVAKSSEQSLLNSPTPKTTDSGLPDSDSAYSSPLSFPDSSLGDSCDPRAKQECVSVSQLMRKLVEFNKETEQENFDRSMVECAVCFSERSGRQSMRFLECHHAFCRDCLREYFRVQIKDGNVQSLTCPEPECESQAYPYQVKELVTAEEYDRYDQLLLQTTLDTMADVVYCPRRFCQHPVIKEANSNLGQCPACRYTFCTLCKLGYHGPTACRIKSDELRRLREDYLKGNEETKRFLEKRYGKRAIHQALEEIYSAEWLEQNAKMCPSCGTQIQKTDGCNKMTCIKCRSYFCWLCDKMLSRTNPYGHFNQAGGECTGRLFEGMDEDDNEWWEDELDDWLDEDEELAM